MSIQFGEIATISNQYFDKVGLITIIEGSSSISNLYSKQYNHYNNGLNLYYDVCNEEMYYQNQVSIEDTNNKYSLVTSYDNLRMPVYCILSKGNNQLIKKKFSYSCSDEIITTNMYKEDIYLNNSSLNIEYQYDRLGNLITHSIMGQFVYDNFNQLTRFVHNSIVENYEYDIEGNITKKGSIDYVYDSLYTDRLIMVGNKAVTYDNKGNIQSYDNKTFSYEGRRLVKVDKDNFSYYYYYDALGNRYKKEKKDENGNLIDSIYYFYQGRKITEEIHGSYSIEYIYENDNLLGFYYKVNNSINSYWYIRDIFGNILGIVDSLGNVVTMYEIDPWGLLLNTTGSMANTIGSINPFRYKGYYYDGQDLRWWDKDTIVLNFADSSNLQMHLV